MNEPNPPTPLSAVPAPVREPLSKFVEQLAAAAGDALLSVVLHGGLARGEYHPGSSDVNVLIIFRAVNVPLLDKIAPVIDLARREFELSLLVLDEADLPVCADVFPVKFRDIARHHLVLHGSDPLGGMEFTRERLKRQCARQIQNLQLRLRTFYLARARRPERIEQTLEDLLSSFLHDLAVAVELQTGNAPATKPATISAAEKLGLDCAVLHELVNLKSGALAPDAAGLKQLYGRFLTVVDKAEQLLEKT